MTANMLIFAGWTADDIAVMGNHDQVRSVILEFNSRRSGASSARSAGGMYGDEDEQHDQASRHKPNKSGGGGLFSGPALEEGEILL